MRIAAGYLLIAFVLFINSIELVSSEPRSLQDLFPGYSGIMPPVKAFRYEENRHSVFRSSRQIRIFETFGDKTMDPHKDVVLFRRAHLIIGWDYTMHEIDNLCWLFPHLENVFIVFDMDKNKWLTLPENLLKKLGAFRDYQLVAARDEVAATHVSTSTNPLYKEAHMRACKEANDRADTVEEEQVDLLEEYQAEMVNSTRAIKEEYSQSYNRAFMLHLHPHGEYNIHGYKERHP